MTQQFTKTVDDDSRALPAEGTMHGKGTDYANPDLPVDQQPGITKERPADTRAGTEGGSEGWMEEQGSTALPGKT
jgi:hypothetical protein